MCALEFPGIETDLWQAYQATGTVQVLAVSADTMNRDNDETLAEFAAQTGISFPIGYDLSDSYTPIRQAVDSISPYPVDLIIDGEGNIAYLSGEYDPDAMSAVLDALL